MTRFLGVDFGTKRVGLAISDGIGLTARPLDVVPRKEAVERIGLLQAEYGFQSVVVGLPTGLGGAEGVSAEGARSLGSEIEGSLEVEIVYVDEKFTSKMAEGVLLESGMKRRARKERVDSVAAAIILQTFLDLREQGNYEAPEDVEPPEIK